MEVRMGGGSDHPITPIYLGGVLRFLTPPPPFLPFPCPPPQTKCFICGIGSDYFDTTPHGFETHTLEEHNLANYM